MEISGKAFIVAHVLNVFGARKLTALYGKDGEVVDRVDFSVQRLGCADDAT